jgi:Arc/MetJ-type ribon-helix-helix transcriptional regulator
MDSWYGYCMSEQITFRIPRAELETLDEVTRGRYATRADAIRAALRLLVKEERDRLIRESYVRAYEATPEDDWVGEAGAAAIAETVGGHDAKLLSRLKKAADSGDPAAKEELQRRGWV